MFTTRPEIVGTFGVVASTHWLATAAGMAILEKGGNAFDAAVATGLSLHILEPDQNGPGGDVPLILYSAQRDEVKVICGQGTAPARATVAAYRDLGLDVVPGIGLLSAVVPGYRRSKPVRRPKLDAFTGVIDRILDEDRVAPRKQRHTAKRIFERLRDEHGFTGGYIRLTPRAHRHLPRAPRPLHYESSPSRARGPPMDFGDKLHTVPKWYTFAPPRGRFLLRR